MQDTSHPTTHVAALCYAKAQAAPPASASTSAVTIHLGAELELILYRRHLCRRAQPRPVPPSSASFPSLPLPSNQFRRRPALRPIDLSGFPLPRRSSPPPAFSLRLCHFSPASLPASSSAAAPASSLSVLLQSERQSTCAVSSSPARQSPLHLPFTLMPALL